MQTKQADQKQIHSVEVRLAARPQHPRWRTATRNAHRLNADSTFCPRRLAYPRREAVSLA